MTRSNRATAFTPVLCVGQWFFVLFGKCINPSWHVTLVVSRSVFLARFPTPFRLSQPFFLRRFRIAIE
jgi:hypothetical protein